MEPQTIDEILEYLVETIGGDWLLAGGALVRLSFDASRGTEDIDLARMGHPSKSKEASLDQLYRWLISKGQGPEWVNTAMEPFLGEVSDWQKETVLLREGARGAVHRPTLTLFAFLKLRRGTPIDLEDVRKAVGKCPENFDEAKFRAWAHGATLLRFENARAALGL